MNDYRLECQMKDVPIGFVNALRRILLHEIPVVHITHVDIVENNTNLTNEMLRHRMEQLPVNVTPEEKAMIRDTTIELRYLPAPEAREITTDDFGISGGERKDVLLKDRDLGTPLFFMNLNPNQSIHIKARLGLAFRMDQFSIPHVSVSTFMNHIDETVMKLDRDTYIAEAGDDKVAQQEAAKQFDNFYYQRSYSRDEKTGRPNWFDFTVESIGVLKAKPLLQRAASILRIKVQEFANAPVESENDGWYYVEMEEESFTIGQLVQEILYHEDLVDYVSRDIGHPLQPKLTVRFHSKTNEKDVMEGFRKKALALCENVLTTL